MTECLGVGFAWSSLDHTMIQTLIYQEPSYSREKSGSVGLGMLDMRVISAACIVRSL
jgi:hypothetical protein